MKLLSLLLLVILSASVAQAESSLAFDSALGLTSNGDLSATNPVGDRIFTVGGVSRFDLGQSAMRAALKYTGYAKLIENDLISADFGTSWKSGGKVKSAPTYSVKATLRDYLHDAPASTDQGFTHFGLRADANWKSSLSAQNEWTFNPAVELEHYPSYFNRSDVDLSFLFELSTALTAESNLSVGVTPGLLISTLSDFSKLSLIFSIDYDQTLQQEMAWGAGAYLTPGFYLSRLASATSTIVVRSKGKSAGSTALLASQKETTFTFSPNLWWSKELNDSFNLRLETALNIQKSKSGSYNYSEVQAFAAIHYRVF